MHNQIGVPYKPAPTFKKGDRVYIGRKNGEKTLCEVIRVNPKTISAKTLEARGMYVNHPVGTKFRCGYSYVTPESAGRPAQITKPARQKRPCLVNVLTGKRTYGRPGECEDSLFGRMANDLL